MHEPELHAIVAERVFDGIEMRSDAAVVMVGDRVEAVVPILALSTDVPRLALPAGHILSPGFIDLQVNGGGGVLFNDDPTEDGAARIAQAHRMLGTTSLLPTLISGGTDSRDRALDLIAPDRAGSIPGVLGLHLEGPFLNPARHGAHPRDAIVTITPADVERLGAVRRGRLLLTLAPECVPPAAIRHLAASGVVLFAGHTDADFETAALSLQDGVRGVTHLFNAMSGLTARGPGAIGAALASDAYAGIIADGHHVHCSNVRLALAMKGADRLFLVSDAMPTVGTTMECFMLGDRRITRIGTRLTDETGALAGAHLCLADAVRIAVTEMEVPLTAALRMATATPASCLGLDHRLGRLVPGALADLVELDAALHVRSVWHGGLRQMAGVAGAPMPADAASLCIGSGRGAVDPVSHG